MTAKRACTAGIATVVVLTTAAAAAESPATPYQPLAFLIGHCWIGTFPDGKVTDEHCFRGTVSAAAEALVFPPASYQERGQTQTYRSRWQRAGSDAYDVVTEFRVGEQWVPRFTVHMKQERN